MRTISIIIGLLITVVSYGQIANNNTLSINVNSDKATALAEDVDLELKEEVNADIKNNMVMLDNPVICITDTCIISDDINYVDNTTEVVKNANTIIIEVKSNDICVEDSIFATAAINNAGLINDAI